MYSEMSTRLASMPFHRFGGRGLCDSRELCLCITPNSAALFNSKKLFSSETARVGGTNSKEVCWSRVKSFTDSASICGIHVKLSGGTAGAGTGIVLMQETWILMWHQKPMYPTKRNDQQEEEQMTKSIKRSWTKSG